jgi:23S rRNA pseudouridine1911/1915/1917 synthase
MEPVRTTRGRRRRSERERSRCLELGQGGNAVQIPILHEDRSAIAIDKPAGWLLIPFSWQSTQRNLQAAITSSIAAGDHWAKSRNLKFLRAVHRLDGETSGVLLLARSPGAVDAYADLFESRRIEKRYLVVADGVPRQSQWICRSPLSPDPDRHGRVRVDAKAGKEAETAFRVLAVAGTRSLIEARPLTGRTHQIRVHLLVAGHPVAGDDLYGKDSRTPQTAAIRHRARFPLGLRAIELAYADPFLRRRITIRAPVGAFLEAFGFAADAADAECAEAGGGPR